MKFRLPLTVLAACLILLSTAAVTNSVSPTATQTAGPVKMELMSTADPATLAVGQDVSLLGQLDRFFTSFSEELSRELEVLEWKARYGK